MVCSFFFFFFQPPQIGCLPYFHTCCGLSVNLRCRSETCCTRLAESTGRKNNVAKNRHLGTIAQLCRAISSQLRHVSTIGKKNLLSSNIFSRCPHMANFGPLTAEIDPVVWGTPANFNGFRVLESLLHGTLYSSALQPYFAALNRWRHLYSAGRPTRWALATFLVVLCFLFSKTCNTKHDAFLIAQLLR